MRKTRFYKDSLQNNRFRFAPFWHQSSLEKIGLPLDELLTAYHEAGHAVIGTLLGGAVTYATIDGSEEGDRYGGVEIRWDRGTKPEQKILTILAGPVAEMIYRSEPLHPALVPEWSDDWKQAWELIPSPNLSPESRTRYLEAIIRKLHKRLSSDDCWAAIAAVSDLLLAHDSIEQEEIEEEIGQWIASL